MYLLLQAISVLSIAAGAGLIALLLAATPPSGDTHITVEAGVSTLSLDYGLGWATAIALTTFGWLALALTSVGRHRRRNTVVRQDVQGLIHEGRYGEARIRAQDLGGFLNVVKMIEAIDQAEKGAGPNANGAENGPERRVSRVPLKGE
jgi:hypothetical protein